MTQERTDLCSSPFVGGKQMSSSLKEKLKRSARGKASPLATTYSCNKPNVTSELKFLKHVSPEPGPHFYACSSSLKIDVEEANCAVNFIDDTLCKTSVAEIEVCDDKCKLMATISSLKAVILKEEEELRKLLMVQRYRSKHDPESFVSLIGKWKTAAQEALKNMYELLPEPKQQFPEMVDQLQIDHKLINYTGKDSTFA